MRYDIPICFHWMSPAAKNLSCKSHFRPHWSWLGQIPKTEHVCGNFRCRKISTMTDSYVLWFDHMWLDSFICDMTLSYDMTHQHVPWLMHMWHWWLLGLYVTYLIHVWHDAFIRDMTHSYVTWPTVSSCVAWLIFVRYDSFMRDMTPSYVTYGSPVHLHSVM